MGDSFAVEMLDQDIDVPCPACGYALWVRLVEVVVGCTLTCPACRVGVRLVDSDGSVRNAGVEIEAALNHLGDTLKGLFS